MKRTASERSKARSKYHSSIDKVGILNDFFVETFLTFLKQRLDELAPESVQLIIIELSRLAVGLAVLPNIKALTRLFAEFTIADQTRDLTIIGSTVSEYLRNMLADIEPNNIA